MNVISTQYYDSPCGRMILGTTDGRLCLCDWTVAKHKEMLLRRLGKHFDATFVELSSDVLDTAKRQLDEYFEKRRTVFDLPLALAGTPFQKRVWDGLLSLSYSTTISYGELARRIGSPKAVRAVASAVGANAIAVIIPCHRIVGVDGSLTGFAGGLSAKRFLLELENRAGCRELF